MKFFFSFSNINIYNIFISRTSSYNPSIEKEIARETRKKMKEQRQKKKERKRHRKVKFELECSKEKMNCFYHDKDHWRTAPKWDDEPFCFCMNANNNTFSCLRTINQTHNYLYCEFTTGLVTFYDLKKGEFFTNELFIKLKLFFIKKIDPFELKNMESSLTSNEKSFLHDTLEHMKGCKGKSCVLPRKNFHSIGHDGDETSNNINSVPFKTSRRRNGKIFF